MIDCVLFSLQEVVQEYRDRQREINVRPIKKVVEAKARKKRRALRRIEKTKKKAENIAENMAMTDYDKAQQIRQYGPRTLSNLFYRILPSFTRFYQVLASSREFYLVLPSFTEFYQVLSSSIEF